MAATYITRTIERTLARAATEFPALVLTGPRQSGKTTALRHLFGRSHRYVSLEAPDVRAAAVADPRAFLDLWSPPVILDELQHAPDLLPYIQERIDARRSAKAQFVLSGSQNLLLLQQVAESLAGRVAVLHLLGLSQQERRGQAAAAPWWSRRAASPLAPAPKSGFWAEALRGGWPELHAEPRRKASLWFASYGQTYLERDVRTVRQVGDLTQFQSFLRLLAARSGQLLNVSDVGRDLGLATNTVKAWISVLEATHQVFILRPYFANLGKRLVKTPKIYFTDTGLLGYLVGLREPDHAAAGPMAGAIAETAVVTEVAKSFLHRGLEPRLSFWRTSSGDEVDLVVETPAGPVPIEVKATATPRPAMAESIRRFRALIPTSAPGFVVHLGAHRLPLGGGTIAMPLREL